MISLLKCFILNSIIINTDTSCRMNISNEEQFILLCMKDTTCSATRPISCNFAELVTDENTGYTTYKITLTKPLVMNVNVNDENYMLIVNCYIPYKAGNSVINVTYNLVHFKTKNILTGSGNYTQNIYVTDNSTVRKIHETMAQSRYIMCAMDLHYVDKNILKYLNNDVRNRINMYYLCMYVLNKQKHILNKYLTNDILIDAFKHDIITMILNG